METTFDYLRQFGPLLAERILDSADNTGCTPDLTVVAAKPVEALREALARI